MVGKCKAGVLAFLAAVLMVVIIPQSAFAADETHLIAVCSDRHGNETALAEAMAGMPDQIEYVSIIGDMVGAGATLEEELQATLEEKAPTFDTSAIYNEVAAAGFRSVKSNDDVSILWADHDANANDDADILFANAGCGSGLMQIGLNKDKSVAYYIYGIAFYELTDVAKAEKAARKFERWIDTIQDKTIPVLVFCHVPLHIARGDNGGAVAWNKALNYAATGQETTTAGAPVIRNVIYFYGHNHTVESKKGQYSGEFYVPCGASMIIGTEEENKSCIYYTYVTAGYLNQNKAACLIAVSPAEIIIDKYQNGQVVDGLYDTESRRSGEFASEFVTAGSNCVARIQDISKASVTGVKAKTFTGKKLVQVPVVKLNGKTLAAGTDYAVSYRNNKNPGTASIAIAGKGNYIGEVTKTFKIAKADNTLAVTGKTTTVKQDVVQKKAKSIAASKVLAFANKGKGAVTYAKASGDKKISINKRTGKVTLRKGLKKGVYKVIVKVTAAGNAKYKKTTKKATVKVVIN